MSCQSALYISFFLRLLLLRLHRRERPYYYYYYFLFFFFPSSVKISISSGWNGTHIAAAAAEEITKKNWKKGEKRRRSVQQKRPTHHQCSLYHERITPIISNEIEKKKFEFFFYRNKRSTSRGVNSFFCVFPLVRENRMLLKTQTNCTRHGISEMTFKVHWSNQNERKMGGGKEKSSASIIQPVIGVFIFPILLFIRGDHRSSIYARGKRETCRQGGPWSLYLT